jgi:HEPN domain-containing protein
MNATDPKTAAWLEKAAHDWKTIQIVVQARGEVWDVVCFLAQQTMEKVLKAFLVSRGVVPKKTHDLNVLLAEAVQHDAALKLLQPELGLATRFAVAIRYPGSREPTPDEGRAVVKSAARVRKAILGKLGTNLAVKKRKTK